MARKTGGDPSRFRLQPTVRTPADVLQLGRELESLETYLQQARLRAKEDELVLPKTSRGFSDLYELNGLDMLRADERKLLAAFLQVIHTKAPVLHISFGAEPSSACTARVVGWLREHVSPFTLVRIGRQPTIGGGCVVRTANRQFDFSFRQYLESRRGQLSGALADVAARTAKGAA